MNTNRSGTRSLKILQPDIWRIPALREVQELETRCSRQHLNTNTQTRLSKIQHSSSSVALSGGVLDTHMKGAGSVLACCGCKGKPGSDDSLLFEQRASAALGLHPGAQHHVSKGQDQRCHSPACPRCWQLHSTSWLQHASTADSVEAEIRHTNLCFSTSHSHSKHTHMFYCMLQKTDMNKAADSQTTDGSCNRLFSTPTPLGLSFLSLWLCFSNNQQQENKEDLCTCLLRLPLFPLKHNSKLPDTGISSVSCCLLKTHCC